MNLTTPISTSHGLPKSVNKPLPDITKTHFISQGNIFNIITTEHDIQTRQIWNNKAKKKYLTGAFVQPDETHFAAIDDNNLLQIFYMRGKEEV